jgi:hypothetical protein
MATLCPPGKGCISVLGTQGHPSDISRQNAVRRTESFNGTAKPERIARLQEKEKQKWSKSRKYCLNLMDSIKSAFAGEPLDLKPKEVIEPRAEFQSTYPRKSTRS